MTDRATIAKEEQIREQTNNRNVPQSIHTVYRDRVPVIGTDWNNHTEESNTVSDIIILV